MRLVEALDIVPKDISFNNCYIRINNRRSRTRRDNYYREIYIDKELIEELHIFITNNNIQNNERIFNFTSKTGINYIHIACIKAGINQKVTAKTFRLSFARNLILEGIDDFNLNYLLGNVDIKKTILFKEIIFGQYIA